MKMTKKWIWKIISVGSIIPAKGKVETQLRHREGYIIRLGNLPKINKGTRILHSTKGPNVGRVKCTTKKIYGLGRLWVHWLGFRGPALVLFSFSVNVSGMEPRSRLPYKPLTVLAPWFLLHAGWFIPLVPAWITSPVSLRGIGRLSLNVPLSLHF